MSARSLRAGSEGFIKYCLITGVSAIFNTRASSLFTVLSKRSRIVSDAIESCCLIKKRLVLFVENINTVIVDKAITKKSIPEKTRNVLLTYFLNDLTRFIIMLAAPHQLFSERCRILSLILDLKFVPESF